ncbi:MAG: Ni/Fe-hydrogenase cytochrome b subunit [Deltaproteobacteria bacterium]|jgi:Ni/Fe-hydrogenase subunit HybB-like protein|nr:Ni/Fe-hydrogenase cytochrome b subunit [Deltaproteobacteria bacterium]MBT4268193.1 Ni/Fe-hydrogenase cytochrome b subunit [Deltaproteobacteria bacterium]MBT4640178.1 Ni/Fe-hydrogenase cytochrome b subunit [Deltaproteobacteria bacterium]MBT6499794.1 Ni/Fe-hydrogenase cytochrome b subunit [Deltaproteobacteria bacterium]MBT6614119.1 Ni/Fe-hydrogenase cytochrome b subunit [Deltaproteobacteria bacterium]
MGHAKPLGGKIFTPPILFLSALFLISAYFLVLRYINGIGYVSNLTDNQSWGIWKVIGVLVGAAFVNGGYVTAFFVYIMNKGAYHRFVRQAVLFSLLGYSFAGLSLTYDTGRYVNLLNFFIPKYMQPNSALFEVGVCITAYIVILAIEFLPALLEKIMPEGQAQGLAAQLHGFLNKILFLTVAFGVVLPTMHQSGLGQLAMLFGQKLSPLWQTPLISLLYVISSIFMGFCIVTALECVYTSNFKKKEYVRLLGTMMKVAGYVAILYIILRWIEVVRNGAVGQAFVFDLKANFFWLEWILIIVGLYFVRNEQARFSPKNLFLGASFMMSSGLLYRLNSYIIGYQSVQGQSYFPSFPELMISVGMFALQLVLFVTIVKIFPVMEKE